MRLSRLFILATAASLLCWTRTATVLAQNAPGDGSAPTSQPAQDASPLERANADAVARLEAQIASERLDDGTTIAQILDRVGGRTILANGLNDAEQIGGPRYVTDDLVQVQRQISGARAASLVKQAVDARPEQCPITRDRLNAMLSAWDRGAFTSTGNSDRSFASVEQVRSSDASQPSIALPDRPPSWSMDPIVVSATSASTGSQLRTARAAERDARTALKAHVAQLPLDDRHTLADLAGASPAAGDLINRAVREARISDVDYRPDGSVEIHVALDGQRLWQMIQISR